MTSYEDVVRLLLKIVTTKYQPVDTFIPYIVVSILNSLACQVDYSEKRLLGHLGAVQVHNGNRTMIAESSTNTCA